MTGYSSHEIIGQSPDLLKGINDKNKQNQKISAMTLKEESVIEMIAYKRPRRILVAIFHDSDLQFRK
jgi:hypothetical protein